MLVEFRDLSISQLFSALNANSQHQFPQLNSNQDDANEVNADEVQVNADETDELDEVVQGFDWLKSRGLSELFERIRPIISPTAIAKIEVAPDNTKSSGTGIFCTLQDGYTEHLN